MKQFTFPCQMSEFYLTNMGINRNKIKKSIIKAKKKIQINLGSKPQTVEKDKKKEGKQIIKQEPQKKMTDKQQQQSSRQKNKSKILFRAQLDQINMNLLFKYDPSLSQDINHNNIIKFGNVTVQLPSQLNGNQKNILECQSAVRNKQKQLSKKKKYQSTKKKKMIIANTNFQRQREFNVIQQVELKHQTRQNNIQYRSSEQDELFYGITTQNDIIRQPNNDDLNQKQKKTQKKIVSKQKSKRNFKKLDLRFLVQDVDQNDEKDIIKNEFEDNQKKKVKIQRNRRIGVYIKGLLKNTTAQSININELLLSVLKNYKYQLRSIKDQNKRLKTLQCLRRRIYECLSVLSAVGLLQKQKKNVSPTQKITDEYSKRKQQKQKLKLQISQKQLHNKYLKQKYFDALTRKQVYQGLCLRNGISIKNKNIDKIYLPIKLIIGYRPGMILKTIKSISSHNINIVTINSKKYVQPIHSVEMFMLLRRILQVQNIYNQFQLPVEYVQSIRKQDKFDKVSKCREALYEKMKIRYHGKKCQNKEDKEEDNEQLPHCQWKSKKQIKRIKKQTKMITHD